MKHSVLITAFLLVMAACTKTEEKNAAIISGILLSGNAENVSFDYIVSNPITGNGETYMAPVDDQGNFSVEIPLERMGTGRTTAGRFSHNICLMPGDDVYIEIEEDTINFSGKGAERNNFLYALEKARLNDRRYYNPYNKGKASPENFIVRMRDIRQKRTDFLETYPEKSKLEKEFTEYFSINNQIIYENLIRRYPERFAYQNKVSIDSLQLPPECIKYAQIASVVDDRKINSKDYLHNMRNFLFDKTRELMKTNRGKNYMEMMYSLLMDSLQGKTREYMLAKFVCSDLGYNRFDSVTYNHFQQLEGKDSLSTETVQKAFDKYHEKRALIGQPLHPAFAETLLEDSTGAQLTFAEMMENHKGKVVYLDIWGLGCGPCRAAMPHSKKLKERLKDVPVEFVYIAQDPPTDDVWENIFTVSQTKENHYRMVNHRWGSSKMLKFMEINWVPCYMIFDKNGCLTDFNAPRPHIRDNRESELEKELKKLAEV